MIYKSTVYLILLFENLRKVLIWLYLNHLKLNYISKIEIGLKLKW